MCALIYRCTYKDGVVAPYDSSLDYSANFCRESYASIINCVLCDMLGVSGMLGYDDAGFDELMRL